MSHSPTLSKSDKEHLASIALTIHWQRIATAMKALDWKYYHIPDRIPTAGELRDMAMERLSECIQGARINHHTTFHMQGGGFSYGAEVCPDTGAVRCLYCEFTIEAHTSTEANDHTPASHD